MPDRKTTRNTEEEEAPEYETLLVMAWPSPEDPPPRNVRLPGLRVVAWPQQDGSVLYEVQYRRNPPQSIRRKHKDTIQMSSPLDEDGRVRKP